MPLRINFNGEALDSQRNLAATQSSFFKSVQRLSSGLRINSASDDAAGLSISETLRAQVKGTAQAQRNAQDAISMINVGEGALNEVHSMLQRMRELAVEANNGTLTSDDRTAIDQEVQALRSEIDAVSGRTQFNGKKLLTGVVSTTTPTITLNSACTTASVGTIIYGNDAYISGMTISGATAATTYYLADNGDGTVTLCDGSGSAQTCAVTAITSGGTGTYTFACLGIQFVVTAGANGCTTAADLASALNGRTITTCTAATLCLTSDLNSGKSVAAAHGTISALDVASGMASCTYTFTDNGNGSVTLSNGTGIAQTITLSAVAASCATVFTFDELGVSFTATATSAGALSACAIATAVSATAVGTGSTLTAGTTVGALGAFTYIDTSQAAAGTYTFTAAAGCLSVSDGVHCADIIILAVVSCGTATCFSSNFYHISFRVASDTTGVTCTVIGAAITGLTLVVAGKDVDTAAATPTTTSMATFRIGPNGASEGNDAMSVDFAQIDVSTLSLTDSLDNFANSINGTCSMTVECSASLLIDALDTAIQSVSLQRGNLGAAVNRLDHTINYLGVANENTATAESRIRDTDIAQTTSEMVRTQILQQAATAVLAQANQAPQAALALLR